MAKSDASPNARDIAWIRELAAILDETGLTEIEIDKDDIHLRVSRGGQTAHAVAPAAPAAPAMNAPAAIATPSGAPSTSAPPTGAVTSPMVGTAYLSASPGSAPFVKQGDHVKEGQTLMIIEAMKTMNPVTASHGGVVSSILVRNEQPVEFGEPLIVID